MRFRLLGCLSLSAAAVFFAGCGGEKAPPLGRVTGTVTLDGQPVPDAAVTFAGANPGDSPSIGKTDATGNYELSYSRRYKGATIGEHTVYISTYQPKTDENPQTKKELIPAKYNGKSELKATVKRGANKLPFDLKSGGEIIQPDDDDQPAKKGKKGRSKTGCF
jgi:hypothetical protein